MGQNVITNILNSLDFWKNRKDLPGEAGTIMHQKKNMGEVELATVSFGQSFQITPISLQQQ